ncbi:MAG: 6-phosphofructokinase [Candidatus Contendobacter sp.]|nr:6-phosphofructokinase [Candidatus Contendobacter sp.]
MNAVLPRIAITVGAGYVPGLHAVITGAVLAASELGWEVVGIRDGFEGLLFRDRYPDGGLLPLPPQLVENLSSASSALLGAAVRNDPFRVRTVNAENQVEEVDRSDELLATLGAERIEAVIAIADARTLSLLWKLNRKGLKVIAVPTSVENDLAATLLSFGFNSALSFATELLDRARQAAQSARKLGVVEVPGEHAGWLALQAGMAVCADVVLIPELPYDLRKVAVKLREKARAGRTYGLVVAAEGARPVADGSPSAPDSPPSHPLRASLSPLAMGHAGAHVIDRSGHVAETVALQLQRLTDQETYPLVLGQWVKGGSPTAVDRQLGLGYGAGAVRALQNQQSGVMVAFQPPDLTFVPLADAINRVRTVPTDSEFVRIARALGISLGD